MNDWWKLGLAGVAGAGLLAATGGAAAPALAGAAGTGGAAAAGPGAAGALGTGAGATIGATSPAATAFVTPSVASPLSGMLAGTALDYGAPAMLAESSAAATQPAGLLGQLGGYAKTGLKAAGAYGKVSDAMGGNPPPQLPPTPQPIFQGGAPQIASGMGAPARGNNAVLAMIARRRQRGF